MIYIGMNQLNFIPQKTKSKMSEISTNQRVLFLMNVNVEPKWFKIGYEKIWIHLLWKIFTNGKYVGELKNGKFHGYGTEIYPDRDDYVGEFKNGKHHVECICLGVKLPLLKKNNLNESRGINEEESRVMARTLARDEGIFAGTSTGLNVVGALQLAKEMGQGKHVVTLACDSGLKYLNGDLFT